MIVFFLPNAATCSPFLRRLGAALEAVAADPGMTAVPTPAELPPNVPPLHDSLADFDYLGTGNIVGEPAKGDIAVWMQGWRSGWQLPASYEPARGLHKALRRGSPVHKATFFPAPVSPLAGSVGEGDMDRMAAGLGSHPWRPEPATSRGPGVPDERNEAEVEADRREGAGKELPPAADPVFSTDESNRVYIECLKVASGCFASWGIQEDGEVVPLSREILRLAKMHASASGAPIEEITGGLRHVHSMLRETERDSFDLDPRGFVAKEANLVRFLIPIGCRAFRFEQAMLKAELGF